jgi:hypothetical protein
MNMHEMTAVEKIEFIQDWSDWFYDHSATFEGELGRQLAYLYPAIVKDEQIEVSSESEIVKLLTDNDIAPDDPIWNYIDVVVDEET